MASLISIINIDRQDLVTSPHLIIISSGLHEAEGAHANKPKTIPELKDEIRRVVNGITQEFNRRVVANVIIKRVEVRRAKRGDHLTDTIYHI